MVKVLKLVPSDFTNESRDLREVSSLVKLGFEVTVLALKSKKTLSFEDRGYLIYRFGDDKNNNNNNIVEKLIKYIKYAKKIVKFGYKYKPDIISAHDLPMLIVAYYIKYKIGNTKLLYDSHELTSEMASNNHQPKIVVKCKKFLESVFIKKADAVMVVSESIARYNQNKFNLKIEPYVIRNIPINNKIEKFISPFRDEFHISNEKIVLLYQGAVRIGRGIDIILEAMKLLDQDVVLVIMGYGDIEKIKNYARKLNLEDRVYFKDPVTQSELIKVSSGADIGICLIENYCLSYYYSLPNKLFEYIQAEIPVICSDFPEMSSIVDKYNIGETADPDNVNNVAEKIEIIIKNLKDTKYHEHLNIAKKELCWELEERKLLKMYNELLGR